MRIATPLDNIEFRADEPESIGTFYVRVFISESQKRLIISMFKEPNVLPNNLPYDVKELAQEMKIN